MLAIPTDDVAAILDANAYFFGPLIGEGDHRRVYEVRGTDAYVFKVAKDACLWANFAEYDLWEAVKNTTLEKHFAPCHSMSPGGRILCMRRADRLARPSEVPRLLPRFISDTHRNNIAMMGGKPVIIDYGIHAARFHGIHAKKMFETHAWTMAQARLKALRKETKNPRLSLKSIEWDV